MRKTIIAFALLIAAVPALCQNTQNAGYGLYGTSWIPLYAGAAGNSFTPNTSAKLYGQNSNGKWYGLAVDQYGNLSAGAIRGATIPAIQIGCLGSSDGTTLAWLTCSGGGGSTWPSGGAGIPNYTGSSAWGTSYSATNQIPANFVNLSAYAPLTVVTLSDLTTAAGGAFGTGAYAAAYVLPATVVQTNQANTYTTGLQDFSAATMKLPSSVTVGVNSITLPTSAGTLALTSQIPSMTNVVYNNQANTYSTGLQDFSSATMKQPSSYSVGSNSISNPSSAGTLALTSQIPSVGTWGALNYPTWASGTPFVKMTAAGTFSLDTNTYLTSSGVSGMTQYGLPVAASATTVTSSVQPSAWTSGHTFVPAWQPSGSALAPTAVDANTLTVSAASTATTATNATNVATTTKSDNTNYYLGLYPANSSSNQGAVVVGATYNPSTNALTIPAGGSVTVTPDGTHAGLIATYGNTTNPSIPSNEWGWVGPASATFTSLFFQPTTTAPSAGQVMAFAAPVSNVSQQTWITPLTSPVALSSLATQAADTFLMNLTAGAAAPTAVAFPTTAHTIVLAEGTTTAPGNVGADTTTTHALFATATDPAFRAIAAADLPAALSSSSSINKVTVTAPATGSTLTIADGQTLTDTYSMNVAKTAGVAGAIPWFDTTTSESASALLTQYGVMIGGGASAAPSTIAASTTTTQALFATATAPAFRAIAAGDIPSAAMPVVTTTVSSGSIGTITTNNTYVICTTTCNLTPMQAAAGVQLCVRNAPGSATVITLNALASSNYYELTSHAGWGTAAHNLVSGGLATDSICLVGYDATHYAVMSYTGTWSD